jgi:hypothetical protein
VRANGTPSLAAAILDSAQQVAVPAIVSTLCIFIVFVPVTLLSGAAKYIFTPLALSVVFAMLASYLLSRTLVATMMHFLLPAEVSLYQEGTDSPQSHSLLWRFQQKFDHQFERFREWYRSLLEGVLAHRAAVLLAFGVLSLASLTLVFFIGEDFFPYVDSGQMQFHVRPPSGTRIEVASEIFARVDAEICRVIPVDPQSLATPGATLVEIVATDELSPPSSDDPSPPLSELIDHAWAQRPDIRQSKLQIKNGERAVAASANARLPEIDLYGWFQSRGVIIPSLVPIAGDSLTGTTVIDPVPAGGIRSSRVFEAGIQFNLPVQNKVAEADLGADRALLRQERLRLTQMEAQAAAEVRNAVIGLNAATQPARAASTAERLQAQLLIAETEKLRAGYRDLLVAANEPPIASEDVGRKWMGPTIVVCGRSRIPLVRYWEISILSCECHLAHS